MLAFAAADPMALAAAPQIAVIGLAVAGGLHDRLPPHRRGIGKEKPQLGPVEPPLRRPHRDGAPIVAEPRRVLEQRRAGDVAEADRDLDGSATARAADEPAGGLRGAGQANHHRDEG